MYDVPQSFFVHSPSYSFNFSFFFFNDTATTEIYTLSLHDALPISARARLPSVSDPRSPYAAWSGHGPIPTPSSTMIAGVGIGPCPDRSEEHTSELQSQSNLVCRLLLEKKKKRDILRNSAYMT